MKKIFIIEIYILIITTVLVGCSSQNNSDSLEAPYNINIKGNILSYYDKESDINKDVEYMKYDTGTLPFEQNIDNAINLIINDIGTIRSIQINSPDIVCFPNISIGDNKNKIEESFEYENSFKHYYLVLFNGLSEVSSLEQSKEDGWIWIEFQIDDNEEISQISLYDVKYGREMQ